MTVRRYAVKAKTKPCCCSTQTGNVQCWAVSIMAKGWKHFTKI